jgi:hypothetical protein
MAFKTARPLRRTLRCNDLSESESGHHNQYRDNEFLRQHRFLPILKLFQ